MAPHTLTLNHPLISLIPAYTLPMLEFLIAAAVFGLSGGLSPGPLLTLVVSETLARGRNAGLAVSMSPLITDGPVIAAAVLLLGRIENSDPALGIVSIAGGALLTTYGIAGLRGASLKVEEAKTNRGVWASLGKGVSVNFLNPNPYLFWLTIGTPILLRAHAVSWFASVSVPRDLLPRSRRFEMRVDGPGRALPRRPPWSRLHLRQPNPRRGSPGLRRDLHPRRRDPAPGDVRRRPASVARQSSMSECAEAITGAQHSTVERTQNADRRAAPLGTTSTEPYHRR